MRAKLDPCQYFPPNTIYYPVKALFPKTNVYIFIQFQPLFIAVFLSFFIFFSLFVLTFSSTDYKSQQNIYDNFDTGLFQICAQITYIILLKMYKSRTGLSQST